MAPHAGSNLRNRAAFPPFSTIRHEDDSNNFMSLFYWRLYWCFLGEIEANDNGFVRLLLSVRDMEGHKLPIYFHTPDEGAPIRSQCNVGYTIAVMYAEKYLFLDKDVGFRIDEISNVKV